MTAPHQNAPPSPTRSRASGKRRCTPRRPPPPPAASRGRRRRRRRPAPGPATRPGTALPAAAPGSHTSGKRRCTRRWRRPARRRARRPGDELPPAPSRSRTSGNRRRTRRRPPPPPDRQADAGAAGAPPRRESRHAQVQRSFRAPPPAAPAADAHAQVGDGNCRRLRRARVAAPPYNRPGPRGTHGVSATPVPPRPPGAGTATCAHMPGHGRQCQQPGVHRAGCRPRSDGHHMGVRWGQPQRVQGGARREPAWTGCPGRAGDRHPSTPWIGRVGGGLRSRSQWCPAWHA